MLVLSLAEGVPSHQTCKQKFNAGCPPSWPHARLPNIILRVRQPLTPHCIDWSSSSPYKFWSNIMTIIVLAIQFIWISGFHCLLYATYSFSRSSVLVEHELKWKKIHMFIIREYIIIIAIWLQMEQSDWLRHILEFWITRCTQCYQTPFSRAFKGAGPRD